MAIISFPVKAPQDAIVRSESPIELLERIKKYNEEWIVPGYISGDNMHNISATISIQDHEWQDVGKWMWVNKKSYNGLSVIPYDCSAYQQAPHEDCSKYMYEKMLGMLQSIDLKKVVEQEDNTTLKDQSACAGGSCSITKI